MLKKIKEVIISGLDFFKEWVRESGIFIPFLIMILGIPYFIFCLLFIVISYPFIWINEKSKGWF